MAATLVVEQFQPTHVLFTGIAGGLNPDLRPGDVVIGAKTAYHGLTTNVLFHLNNSHRATVIQTLTGNEYRDIAADFGHLGEHGGMFRLVAVNSAGRTESEFILVAP